MEPAAHHHHAHDDEEGLWDELNHQQSREIEAHHLLRQQQQQQQQQSSSLHHGLINSNDTNSYNAYVRSGHRPRIRTLPPVVRRLMQQTHEEVSKLGLVFYDAATSAWDEHQQRQQAQAYQRGNSHVNSNHHLEQYLEEFGIPREGEEEVITSADEGGYVQFDNMIGMLGRGRHRFINRNPPAPNNLDLYFSSLYMYYYNRGLLPIISKFMLEFMSLIFTLFLSVFLCYVDWSAISKCTDDATCQSKFSSYLIRHHSHAFLISIYALLFVSYAMFHAWSFINNTLRQALMAKWVFEERLGISTRKLQGGAIDWDKDIVQKLQALHKAGEYRIVVDNININNNNNMATGTATATGSTPASTSTSNKIAVDPTLDALNIAQRILRKENFLVAMINKGLIETKYFSPSLEWSLYFCILNFMFNHKYQVRPSFYLDPSSLKRRFVLCGIIHAVLMPFMLFFLLLHFLLRHAYDFKNTQQYLGPREWSLSSKWMFREFNEYSHLFEKRLAPSYAAADEYLRLFGPNQIIAALGRILVFVSGSLGAVLFVFAAINDAILLHVKIADWNLLWYAGVVGLAYSAGKAMIPTDYYQRTHVRNLFAETDSALSKVTQHTHYSLETWIGRGSDAATYTAIKSMFQYKAQLFASEVASVVLAPYVLCVKWAQSSEAICEYIFCIKTDLGCSGGGEVCGFATFDFDRYQDEAWQGRTFGASTNERDSILLGESPTLSESVMRTGSVEMAARDLPVPKTRYGKMEKSFFSFKSNHPTWKCSASGQHLVDRVEQYKQEETAALSRERELYIEAAARQLETLARLEQQQQHQQPTTGIQVTDEAYIPKKTQQAPADAGAGLVERRYIPPVLQEVPLPGREQSQAQNLSAPPGNDEVSPIPIATAFPNSRQKPPSLAMSSHQQLDQTFAALSPAGLNAGPSSELRRILNMSYLEPGTGSVASLLGDEEQERRAEREYLWLERYHSHMKEQQRQQVDGSTAAVPPAQQTEPENIHDQLLGRSIV